MLVHITLDLTEEATEARADAVLEALHGAGMRDIDARFLKRYALVSGQLEASQIEAVEALDVVKAVEPDGTVTAL
ncbi:hypothetical protein [Deinococcus arcticus]|uniref:Uncharacterized protein n=1 Tax=Deinococcus arcticus TaxID=2136176 RepID=A0A2T3W3B6_9DEIO|nr:hypothetical protein [Deinococcus arcticus]PTA66385.1 hypothetical protein C8263_18275 [Deinococcus arcticus]